MINAYLYILMHINIVVCMYWRNLYKILLSNVINWNPPIAVSFSVGAMPSRTPSVRNRVSVTRYRDRYSGARYACHRTSRRGNRHGRRSRTSVRTGGVRCVEWRKYRVRGSTASRRNSQVGWGSHSRTVRSTRHVCAGGVRMKWWGGRCGRRRLRHRHRDAWRRCWYPTKDSLIVIYLSNLQSTLA